MEASVASLLSVICTSTIVRAEHWHSGRLGQFVHVFKRSVSVTSLPYCNDRLKHGEFGEPLVSLEDGMNGRNCQSPYISATSSMRNLESVLITSSRYRLLSRRDMKNPHLSAIPSTGSTIF
jgi:hypothetical protein